MSRRSLRASASVDTDVCVGRYGCLRRSVRMSASVGADVCVGRCGCLRRSVRISASVDADGENKAKAEVNASAFVVLYRLLGRCSGDRCTPFGLY